ncbi:MAG TPA: D-aminoacylase [Bryobacteraceae bacterium]|nr:D-aminoacylase [Bryobacteraceae bacterium]
MRKLAVTLCALASALAQPAHFDAIVKNAKVVDGTGAPWFYADIGINGDSIAAIGLLRDATAAVEIDARGLIAAPGFIDVHSHGDRGIFATPTAENYLREGVTTFIGGPDGSSEVPLRPFLKRVAAAKPAINFGSMVGQGSIRAKVMGTVNRKATPQEIEQQKELARQAMLDGAFGLSTGLFYVPGNFTPTEEVIEIAKVAGAMGGYHSSHMREEASHVLDSVRETIRIGEEGHLPTQITHHKIIGKENWGKSVETLKLVEAARARGVDVTLDQYPYTASSTSLNSLFPRWSLEGGRSAVLERLNAPDQRARIKAGIVEAIQHDRGAGDPKNVVISNCPFDASLAGKNLAQITQVRGVDASIENAAETAILLEQKGNCGAIYHAISEEDVVRIMRYPFTMIASDGDIPVFGQAAPHPRSYGTFARVLGAYVREQHVLTLEEGVRRMSSLPAQRLKVWDRGILRPGFKADIVVFDPATIADKATFENPHQYSAGVQDAIVNGKLVLRDGKLTGERAGRILYGPAHAN